MAVERWTIEYTKPVALGALPWDLKARLLDIWTSDNLRDKALFVGPLCDRIESVEKLSAGFCRRRRGRRTRA